MATRHLTVDKPHELGSGHGVIRRGQWSGPTSYSEDDIIDAYEAGKVKGRDNFIAEVRQALDAHVDQALDEAERLFFDLKSKFKLDPRFIFLRLADFHPFVAEILYLVPLDQYVSDSMFDAYVFSGDREEELAQNGENALRHFEVDFRFMPLTDDTDFGAIASDGFSFRYERKEE